MLEMIAVGMFIILCLVFCFAGPILRARRESKMTTEEIHNQWWSQIGG